MSDSEYEEETRYVLFDIGTAVTTEYINQVSSAAGGCRITGLEEGQPFLQVGDVTFEGEVDETLGTHMLFEIEERKVETAGLLPLLSSIRADKDSEESSQKQQKYTLKYECSTDNIIKMDTVNLEPKTEAPPTLIDETKADDGSTLDAIL